MNNLESSLLTEIRRNVQLSRARRLNPQARSIVQADVIRATDILIAGDDQRAMNRVLDSLRGNR